MTRQRVDVQVVGRLVEQQHVRFFEQQPEELQPPPLAAGQLRQPRGQLVAGETEVLQQRVGADLPPASPVRLTRRRTFDRIEHPLGRRPAPTSAWLR